MTSAKVVLSSKPRIITVMSLPTTTTSKITTTTKTMTATKMLLQFNTVANKQ